MSLITCLKEILLERRSPSPGLALTRTASIGSESPMTASFTQVRIAPLLTLELQPTGHKTWKHNTFQRLFVTSEIFVGKFF